MNLLLGYCLKLSYLSVGRKGVIHVRDGAVQLPATIYHESLIKV